MTSPDLELYPDEKERVAAAMLALEKFEFGAGNTADRKIFDMAVANEFGKIGLQARVNWTEICSVLGGPTGVWQPGVEVYGRTRGEAEHDHDRHQYGVVHGLEDGQAGYVREDGSKHEDPLKKNIY